MIGHDGLGYGDNYRDNNRGTVQETWITFKYRCGRGYLRRALDLKGLEAAKST